MSPENRSSRQERILLNDRYELEPVPIGRGGMGEVWEGHDVRLDREVAVKIIRFPDGVRDEELVRRFVRESRITARLQHPGVPSVFDVGTHEGRPFLIMQRVHGISVADLVAEHDRLPVGWCAAIAAQVCAVLGIAHQASLVHRDLKPGNLMLEPDGTVKVLDFGLAVALETRELSQITRSGQVLGTPAYMAPEQVLTGTSTPLSDLYSLGCTLHQMLTGRHLFSGSTAFSTMSKQVSEHPPSVRRSRPDTPPELDELLMALLEKRPEDRPKDAHEVYQCLLPFATGLGPIPGVLTPPALPSPVRMYATVVGRVFDDLASAPVSAAQPSRADSSASPSDEDAALDRTALEEARAQAAALVAESRYGQAAEVLERAVDAATRTFGEADSDVVGLLREWASILFEGGDYRRAAPVYESLVANLAERDGPDGELVFRYRFQSATCHALTGDTSGALESLERLLADEERVYGPDDPRPLELRRQIGLLQLGAGRRELATKTLQALLSDLVRVHGPDHPTAVGVRELLEGASAS
ncbi:hypothetical protein GCM10027294_51090 [Marinactinospora endophytica]